MKEQEMITKITDTSFTQHPAWPSFVKEMKDKQYGEEPLKQAWNFYREGWEQSTKSG